MKNIFKLLIFLHLGVCFNAHAQVPGTPYIFARPNVTSVLPSSLTCCVGQVVSVTPCDSISGTRKNDNGTTSGIEYDWSGAVGWLAGNDTVRALIEFGGQCWYRYNSSAIPSNFNPAPGYSWAADVGYHFVPSPASTRPKIGRLYQWSAAMNGATGARAQGVCAPGFHLPSMCEEAYRLINLTPLRRVQISGSNVLQDSVLEISNLYIPFCASMPSARLVNTGFDRVWPSGAPGTVNTPPADWVSSPGAIDPGDQWTSTAHSVTTHSVYTQNEVMSYNGFFWQCTGAADFYSSVYCPVGGCCAPNENLSLKYVRCVAD